MTKTELMTICKSLNINISESDIFIGKEGFTFRVEGKEKADKIAKAIHVYYTKLGYAGNIDLDENAPVSEMEERLLQERAKFKSMH